MRRSRKLKKKHILEIKRLLDESNLTQVQISKMYNVSAELIRDIKSKKTWKYVV